MIAALVLIPAMGGVLAFLVRFSQVRRSLLLAVAAMHLGLTVWSWAQPAAPVLGGWLAEDALGRLVLTITSVLFVAAAVYAIGYLPEESREQEITDFEEGFLFSNAREANFTGCLMLFLSAMTLASLSQHLGLLWVAVEGTTLASAPLIYFHRHHRSLEATWKYLLICSVGIALALLGNFFLAVAAAGPGDGGTSLVVTDLIRHAGVLRAPWLKGAFVLILVGYGTKMGLAPFHTWLPDAHSEAPSVVSALLSGALLNCAFLGILRAEQVCVAAGLHVFAQNLLLVLGLFSMAVAAAFIVGQADYKRMLAYSSVEHMGILALGVGVGGMATFGAMLHVVNHSLTKAALFLVAGNILAVYRSKNSAEIRGILRTVPASGVLWMAGFLAIAGSPPFGPFLSELTILKATLDQGRGLVAILYLGTLAIIFAAMAKVVLEMVQGLPRKAMNPPVRRSPLLFLAPAALCVGVALLGVYVPPILAELLKSAAREIG